MCPESPKAIHGTGTIFGDRSEHLLVSMVAEALHSPIGVCSFSVENGPGSSGVGTELCSSGQFVVVHPSPNQWRKALVGQTIVNVDASFSDRDFSGSCGAVIRDHAGAFLAAATAKLTHVPAVVSAEAAALYEGLKLATRMGCNNLLVQMDNTTVV